MRQSQFLTEMRRLLSDNAVGLEEISTQLGPKGLVFLALVAVLPFMQPIPIPGLSTLLGLVILLQGVGLMLVGRPLLTKKMRAVQLPPEKVRSFVNIAEKIFPFIAWLVQPRAEKLARHRATQFIAGLALVFLAAFLSLPLPIPSSNFLPAIGIFFICLGLLEDDFFLVVLGVAYAVLFAWMLTYFSHLIATEFGDSGWWDNLF